MENALKVLFIDDDTIEVMKFKRTISKLNLNHTVVEAGNGEEALEILEDKDQLPDIILLDLNMPKMNGLEFLSILKANEILRYIPIIVLSTSRNYNDILEGYKHGVAGYMLKPLKYEDYVANVEKTLSYWSMCELIKI